MKGSGLTEITSSAVVITMQSLLKDYTSIYYSILYCVIFQKGQPGSATTMSLHVTSGHRSGLNVVMARSEEIKGKN